MEVLVPVPVPVKGMPVGMPVPMMDRRRLANLIRDSANSSSLIRGTQSHAESLKLGFQSDLIMNNDLLCMYSKCRRPNLARQLFDTMPQRNIVSYMALMTSHLSSGDPESSLMAFRSDVGRGSLVYAACVKSGFESQPFVGNSIIAMYSKCGSIGDSVRVFDAMRERRSLVSWNAMIAGYVNAGCSRKAVLVFAEMRRNCETPDEFTLSSVFKGCGAAGDFAEGKQIHAYVVVSGFPISLKTSVASALIDFYVKCGRLVEARRVIDRTVVKNEVSWIVMMAGYVQEGCLYEAMDLFREIRKVETIVDGFILSSLAGVFADLALIVQGKQIHAYTTKISCVLDVSVANSIGDMYLKCGLIDDAIKRFEEIASKNVVSWTVMIIGYGKHGHAREAIHLFKAMRVEMIEPDEVAYLAVLSACSHAGLVKESREYFKRLRRDSCVQPKVEHYACMVDVLGRAGRLEEAKSLIEDMPIKANVGIWQTLLSACRVHKDLKMGIEVGGILMELDEGNAVNYVMVSNIYAEAEEWRVREDSRIDEEKRLEEGWRA
ncbi:putative pentatricopeptide repeat-containing protein [Acorus calamus]|uniref:Pentatricopeptide repeat-containing protein n=1 Tax=Acorus calamus TaxID=4465 RepID=A0AAV9DK35_ACOCL|nr:putative pentatricopeptide repeat-containing protein [Acorus calamus]